MEGRADPLPLPPRHFAARLSAAQAYRPCRRGDDGAARDDAAHRPCALAGPLQPPSPLFAAVAAATARTRARLDPEALHVLALADLAWAASAEAPLDRAIAALRAVAPLHPRPAAAWTDLAAALLVRAERRRDARDLAEAIEAAARATAADPGMPAAWFDLALAFQDMGLHEQAERAWSAFLQREPTGPWADEARARRARAAPRSPGGAADASPAAPQEARLAGWNVELRAWGAAVLAGDDASAAAALARAAALGRALEARGGDASLLDATRRIADARGSRARTRALALAHRAFADGQAAYAAFRFVEADRAFTAAAAAPRPLGAWARSFAGASSMYTQQPRRAERLLRGVLADADSVRHPALVARTRWTLASVLLRDGRTEAALRELRAAAGAFARAHEDEHLGAVQSIAAHAANQLGDPAVTFGLLQQALAALRDRPRSMWRYNALYTATLSFERELLPLAARAAQDEAVAVAARTGRPGLLAEARVMRARLALADGPAGHARAHAEVRAARAALALAPPSPQRDRIAADLTVLDARLTPRTARARTLPALDTAIAALTQPPTPSRLIPALLARGDARVSVGDVAGGRADVDRVLAMLVAQQRSTDSLPLRASLADAARAVVDRVVMYHVAAGDAAAALAALEDGRTGLTPNAPRTAAASPAGTAAGETALVYAMIGDTLLTWTVRDRQTRLRRGVVARAALAREIAALRVALERGTVQGPDDALGRLFDLLVAPVAAALGPSGTSLLIVPDGELGGVPFAALRDRRRAVYLVEEHPIRLASTARAPARAAPGARDPERRASRGALVIADPTFAAADFPTLRPLAGARAEALAVARLQAPARVLDGATATLPNVLDALPRAAVVHFAGHAVFDDQRPERSALLLARAPADSAAATLPAGRIATLDLRHVRLVVLSACETVRAGTGRASGFSGLAGAFLTAGAGGVVGTLWRVEDEATHALLLEFHRELARTRDPAAALRLAQLAMLHGPDPRWRAPATWAAVRYLGA